MRVPDFAINRIFDSRGDETIHISGRHPWFFSSVPSGKSRGKNEVVAFSYQRARRAAAIIKKQVVGKSFKSVRAFDDALLRLDGTDRKRRLGGNLVLGVSTAFTRALAAEWKKNLWELLRAEYFPGRKNETPPLLFSNLINGGVHARTNLSIQEYMVVVRPGRSVAMSIEKLISFYRALGEHLSASRGLARLPVGDEGGFALDFRDNYEPIAVVENLIRQQRRFGVRFRIALDIAASNFTDGTRYRFGKKLVTSAGLVSEYARYFSRSKFLCAIEDPFSEDDARGFTMLRERFPSAWIVGDDLTTTNPRRIEACAQKGAINAVIIKPNQIGTVTETCRAIHVARQYRLHVIVSHRSGETDDHYIVHLAKAAGADAIKLGAPVRERIFKYNELARLYA